MKKLLEGLDDNYSQKIVATFLMENIGLSIFQ